eukprot:sb/3472365/
MTGGSALGNHVVPPPISISDTREVELLYQGLPSIWSIKLQNQSLCQVEKDTCDYVKKVFAELGSPNKCSVKMEHGGNWWVTDFNDPQYVAGRKATKMVYGVEPDLTREGGSIPVTLTFQKTTGKSVMLLPMGAGDDGAHSQNEKINIRNYIEGHKLFAAYLDEVSKV